jgi:hypothetical protein
MCCRTKNSSAKHHFFFRVEHEVKNEILEQTDQEKLFETIVKIPELIVQELTTKIFLDNH